MENECAHCKKTDVELKRCSGCKKVCYCTRQCQSAECPSHEIFCRSAAGVDILTRHHWPRQGNRNRNRWSSTEIASPYEDGVLPESLQIDVINIRKALRRWLSLYETWQGGSDADVIQATVDLASVKLHPDHAFSRPPKPFFRRVFLSLTKTYWLALLASLKPDYLKELSRRLDLTPPYGVTIPRLEGDKCVFRPAELNAKEIEGLMRTIVGVTMEMVPREVTQSWEELATAGVQLWEENHELKK